MICLICYPESFQTWSWPQAVSWELGIFPLIPVGCIRPSLYCPYGEFPVELEGQMSAFNHWLYGVTGHDSSQLLGMGVPWRLSSMTPSPSIALALHTSAAAFMSSVSACFLPLPPICQKCASCRTKELSQGRFGWRAAEPSNYLLLSPWLCFLSCSISHLHSCVCLLFHHCYTQAVISSFCVCLQLNSLLILTWQKLKRLHIINR